MRHLTWSLLLAIGAGCPASDDDGDPAASTVGTDSGDPATVGTEPGDPATVGTEPGDPSTVGTEPGDPSTLTDAPDPSTTSTDGTSSDTDGSVLTSCAAARTEAECDSVEEDGFLCSWLQTRHWAIGADGTCEDMMMPGGQCVTSYEDSGCGSLDPTCPDGSTVVFFNASDPAGGALELMIAPTFDHCNEPPGWTVCAYGSSDTDGASTGGGTTGGEQPWNPPECACGCPS